MAGHQWHQMGSIPAYAGGATTAVTHIPYTEGRSPRMRGSHVLEEPHSSSTGSIPAYAGEPKTWEQIAVDMKVDPRVCGGAGYA